VTDEQQIAALREEIRRAGRRLVCPMDRLATLFAAGGWICLSGIALGVVGAVLSYNRILLGLASVVLVIGIPVTIIAFVGLLFVATPLEEWRRSRYRRAFRRRLNELPEGDWIAVLRPLRGDGPAQEIVGHMLQELRLSTELTPATAPADTLNYNRAVTPVELPAEERS